MDNFKKISQLINENKIKPTAKWKFVFKNSLIWISFILSLSIGAAAFSIILYSIQQTDFELMSHFSHSKLETVLVFLPFFWIITLIIFSIFAFFSFKKYKKAYKYSPLSIITLSTFLSVLFGTLFFISGGAKKIEKSFANKVSIYKSLEEKKMKIWMNPKDGVLSGTIQRSTKDTIYIIDFKSNKWKITYKDVFIPPRLNLEKGEKIKLIGKQINNQLFIASGIKPWGGFNQQNNKHQIKK
jgi:heme/copper-type cytochrome/quinol oxidase subunit 2